MKTYMITVWFCCGLLVFEANAMGAGTTKPAAKPAAAKTTTVKPAAAKADSSTSPTSLKDPKLSWALKNPLIKEAYEKHDLEAIRIVNASYKKNKGNTDAVLADSEMLKKLETRSNAQLKAKKGGASATTPVVPAAGEVVFADEPTPAEGGRQAPQPQSVERMDTTLSHPIKGVTRPIKGDSGTEADTCVDCGQNTPQDPIVPEQRQNIEQVRDAVNDTYRPESNDDYDRPSRGDDTGRSAPYPIGRVNDGNNDSSGCGFLGCITSSNLMWGLGGALVGGIAGYYLGKHNQPNYNQAYSQYPGYNQWGGSMYNNGGLPGAYPAPGGAYGYGAPPFLPFPGPNPNGLGQVAGGFSGVGTGYYGGQAGYYGPGAGAGFGGGGYYGAGGGGGVLCPNCTLPSMYPLNNLGGIPQFR